MEWEKYLKHIMLQPKILNQEILTIGNILIYKRGDLTFIYNTDCKEVFLNLKTNIGGLNFRIDPRGHFWFVLDAWKVTKRNLLNLDVKPILEILSIIGGEIYVTKDPNNKNCFKFKNYYEDGAVNLKDLPMLAHTL